MMKIVNCAALSGVLALAIAGSAQTPASVPSTTAVMPGATEVRRFPAEEAKQGVATDARFFYAIADHAIGKYDKVSGKRVAVWQGEPPQFIHINSCTVREAMLVCAMSNFPGSPMVSSVERFDTATMTHVDSHSLGAGHGSLTWIDWHNGSWWGCFANYDGRGGEPGRDHRATALVRYDEAMVEKASWLFPEDVLQQFGHMSASGGRWGRDGLLYVTGHDLPEMYVLRLPESGTRLVHVGTIPIVTGGQAFDWDFGHPDRFWSIERKAAEVVESQLPPAATIHP